MPEGELSPKVDKPAQFPPHVLTEASSLTVPPELLAGRDTEEAITIDGVSSRDLDDAIRLEKIGENYIVHISIADVGALVQKGSAIDTTAQEKGFTRYFGEGETDPMIPREVSEDKLSLLPGGEKPTFTVSIPLTKDAKTKGFKIGEAQFRKTAFTSKGKYDYSTVDNALSNESDPAHEIFADYEEVAQKLHEQRTGDESLPIYDFEKGIVLDEEGEIIRITDEEQYKSYMIIHEFMHLANRSVADYFVKNNINALFRNHTAKDISSPHAAIIHNLHEYEAQADVDDLDEFRSNISLVMNKATIDTQAKGHFGLNIPAYLHFTSPIRRYEDLVNHRILTAVLAGEANPYTLGELQEIADKLNTLSDASHQETRQHFIDKANKVVDVFAESGNYSAASEKEMDRIIKSMVRRDDEYQLPPALREEIETRINEGNLPIEDLFMILTKQVHRDADWEHLQIRVIRFLQRTIAANKAGYSGIIDLGVKRLSWQRPSHTTEKTDTDEAGRSVFTASATLNVGEDRPQITSDEGKHYQVKHAKNLATIDAIAKYFHIPLEQEPEILPFDIGKPYSRSTRNRRERIQRPVRRDET